MWMFTGLLSLQNQSLFRPHIPASSHVVTRKGYIALNFDIYNKFCCCYFIIRMGCQMQILYCLFYKNPFIALVRKPALTYQVAYQLRNPA